MKTSVVVGNPRLESRTAQAAAMLATALTGTAPHATIEVAQLGPALLGWNDPVVDTAVSVVAGSRLVVVASPTFKATYSGLLKLFLDQFAGGTGLQGVVAIPLMLGAAATHAMAAESLLKPVLVHLGAVCPAPGLFLLENGFEDGQAIRSYAKRWGPVARICAGLTAQGAFTESDLAC